MASKSSIMREIGLRRLLIRLLRLSFRSANLRLEYDSLDGNKLLNSFDKMFEILVGSIEKNGFGVLLGGVLFVARSILSHYYLKARKYRYYRGKRYSVNDLISHLKRTL